MKTKYSWLRGGIYGAVFFIIFLLLTYFLTKAFPNAESFVISAIFIIVYIIPYLLTTLLSIIGLPISTLSFKGENSMTHYIPLIIMGLIFYFILGSKIYLTIIDNRERKLNKSKLPNIDK